MIMSLLDEVRFETAGNGPSRINREKASILEKIKDAAKNGFWEVKLYNQFCSETLNFFETEGFAVTSCFGCCKISWS